MVPFDLSSDANTATSFSITAISHFAQEIKILIKKSKFRLHYTKNTSFALILI